MSIESRALQISILVRERFWVVWKPGEAEHIPLLRLTSRTSEFGLSPCNLRRRARITQTPPALPQYRLSALFGTTIQITREIYRFYHITAVIDVKIPHLQPRWYRSVAAWSQAITISTRMLEGNTRIWHFESIKDLRGAQFYILKGT